MDFSYFNSAPQPYHFFTLPPTPVASSTPQPDDFKMNLGNEGYDSAFANFQQSFHLDPATFLTQPNSVLPPQSPPEPIRAGSTASIPDATLSEALGSQPDGAADDNGRARSSSEEKELMTPAQSRRKAQNRAAQRAFRERKERHVKDLEAKLTTLQHHSASLNGENERLKRELAKIATENEILRATSGPNPFLDDLDDMSTGPLRYSPTDYCKPTKKADSTDSSLNDASTGYSSATGGSAHSVTRRILDEETGEPLLAAGATWDYIQAHELFRRGLVDVGDVCERLKKMARCDGQGPVFQESDVRRAIAESAVAGGRDELI